MFQDFINGLEDNAKKSPSVLSENLFTTKIKFTDNVYWYPDFLSEDNEFLNEYSFEWKSHLLVKNSDEVKNCGKSEERFTFYTTNIVRYIFDICKVFQQPPEVRYLAIDIFDRFLVKHFFDVANLFEEMENKSSGGWEIIVKRILDQSLLRVSSCIQLANKYCWTRNLITPSTIQDLMREMGHLHQFSKKSIIKSEARVYQTLNYSIPLRTPLTYLEMYFDHFQRGYFPLKISLGKFFKTSIYVLDIAIVYHQLIYQNFTHFMNFGEHFRKDSDEYLCVAALKSDYIVLIASVIFASSLLVDSDTETSEILLKILCFTGECEKYYVKFLGREILKSIQNV